MADAVWNGYLRLSLVSCPVRLAPATSEANVIRLDQLNSRTGNPVNQQYVDSRTGDVVPAGAVVRGFKTAAGNYVTISDSEYDTLSGADSNIIEVAHFIPRDQMDRARIESSYYVYPEGQLANDTLAALRLAMLRSGRDALAYVRLGDRERMTLIQPFGAGLMASTLRPPQILEKAEFLERADHDIPAEMIEIAEAIITRRSLSEDANAMHDRYEERLRSIIEQKAGGAAGLPPQTGAGGARPSTTAGSAQPGAAVGAEAVSAAAVPAPLPEPDTGMSAAPAPEREPEGSTLAGAPDLRPIAAAMQPAAEPPPEHETEPEGSVLAADEEAAAAAASEPEPEPAHAATAANEARPTEEEPPADTDQQQAAYDAPLRAGSGDGGRELGTEILLHIMGLGDRRFVEPGWAGHPGSRRQIEAMSIRPREELEPSAIEFRVFAQEGRATAWVSNGNYAGTRGRQLPLTGFAVRPAMELRDRFDVVYEGCFFEGGVVGPRKNGEICTSSVANDPLEAVHVSIIERRREAAE